MKCNTQGYRDREHCVLWPGELIQILNLIINCSNLWQPSFLSTISLTCTAGGYSNEKPVAFTVMSQPTDKNNTHLNRNSSTNNISAILIYLGDGLLSLCILTLNLNSPLSCCTSSGARSGEQGSRVATRRAYIGNKSSLQWNQTFQILGLDKDFLLHTWQNIGQWQKSLNTHALPTLFLEQQEWLDRVFFCFPLCCMFAWILLLPTDKKITSCMSIFNLVA